MKLSTKAIKNLSIRDRAKAKRGRCAVRFCGKKRTRKDPLCPRCRKRNDKATDPERYTFNALKSNARRRGKPFEITLDDFKKFCAETGYIQNKGRRPGSMTIDRIDSSRGYVLGNLRVISNSENSAKGNRDTHKQDNENLPF